ncbi:DUF779 domain-containing protein [Mycolicibacterium fluoranthenivorans]|uniref:DUF779 domain-containing protein n=1 Tax=Mycolicibacterium fluoranthenivorans TaxID=258505 RepID=A0A7X5TXC9_9MYCO|nr:DUF779 domain-containing protein [Mycolicibacterium fluoranthenivorans]MCV7353934.1 DUF779 domain-containing protein [Mycolicibacterium fluoranthenivorans]NIH94464.1 hypothetical protein [Mycolicibacterium fluoranthenivorans]
MSQATRVLITRGAADLVLRLQNRYGALMFHQSGGTCDGSSPMCYPVGEYAIGDSDVLLGVLDVVSERQPYGVPVWVSGPQYTVWEHSQLVIDVVPGRAAGFSLEASVGLRFLSRARVVPERNAAVLPRSVRGCIVTSGATEQGVRR